MKKIGQHVLKGKFDPDDGVIRITLFDGKFDTGYRVVKFEHALSNPLVNEEYKVVVGTSPNITNTFSWDKNIEIAWGYGGNNNTTSATFSNFAFVDPENLIIEDLYLVGNNLGTGLINYMITLEKYDLTDWEGAAAMAINKE
tara:strand:- start:97 stop:522 length:426 start_codon:yes stop_codon:yes gene_type:complete